jgi:alkylhydroperoxidase/carboxymuconolactone decarboxylase family protein YurZ
MSAGADLPEHLQRLLRLLTIGDEATIDRALHGHVATALDNKASALVTIAALVATEADDMSYQSAIDRAHVVGVDDHEILEAVVTIAPLVGAARIASAMPAIECALEGGDTSVR